MESGRARKSLAGSQAYFILMICRRSSHLGCLTWNITEDPENRGDVDRLRLVSLDVPPTHSVDSPQLSSLRSSRKPQLCNYRVSSRTSSLRSPPAPKHPRGLRFHPRGGHFTRHGILRGLQAPPLDQIRSGQRDPI
jgi:hypothetical protein